MHTRIFAIIFALLFTGLTTGCGQKGPLYLPGSPSQVQAVTQQPPQEAQTAEEDEEDDDSGMR